MATSSYISGRKKYSRPQAMLWADNPGTITESGLYVPQGYEVGAELPEGADESMANQFLILTDNNRLPIDMSFERIEQRERMINGRMRSYHIADKVSISTSWENVPSRSYASDPLFDQSTGKSPLHKLTGEYTTDGGAGAVELLDWYSNHPGSFWVYLAYDNYKNFNDDRYSKLGQYNEVIEVFFADFQYSIASRGGSNYDFWDISVKLEEV